MARKPARPHDDDLVYSTDGAHLRRCPRCGQEPCACPPAAAIDPARTLVRMRLETQGRGGKAVTVLHDLPPNDAYWAGVLKRLKAHCGTGGTAKAGRLELQGDRRDPAQRWLEAQGFTVRRSGG